MAWDQQFEEILRKRLPYLTAEESLTADLSLRDYGLDSMGVVELLKALEKAYGIELADDAMDLANFETPGVLWQTLEPQVA
jgi:acyl carrier protein